MPVRNCAHPNYYFRQKNGIFYFRLMMPSSVLNRFPNIQKEIRKTLRTANLTEARRRAATLYMHTLTNFNAAIENLETIDEAIRLIPEILKFHSNLPTPLLDKIRGKFELIVEQNKQILQQRFLDDINEQEAKCLNDIAGCIEFIAQFKHEPLLIGGQLSDLDPLVPLTNQLTELTNKLVIRSVRPNQSQIAATHIPIITTGDSESQIQSNLFSKIAKEFIDERTTGGNWEDKTKQAYEVTFKIFQELYGEIPVESIDAKLCRKFKIDIQKLPRNHSKDKRFRELSIKQLIDKNVDKKDRISVESVNKHLTRIGSMLNWCVDQGYIDKNYMSKLRIKSSKSDKEKREPFTSDNLNVLFNDPIFTKCKRPKQYYFWLPLIALYSGQRIQEICQLELDDVYEQDGVHIFNINNNSDTKRVKTKTGIRVIPVHRFLIELGLLSYIASLKKHDKKVLFPELEKHASKGDGQSQPASKWFARYKVRHGFKTDGVLAFHSFRHSFIDELKRLNTPEHITASLVGHAHNPITYGTYGGENSINLLNDYVQKIEYPGFDTSRIKWVL